jgi:hypothetical protein
MRLSILTAQARMRTQGHRPVSEDTYFKARREINIIQLHAQFKESNILVIGTPWLF